MPTEEQRALTGKIDELLSRHLKLLIGEENYSGEQLGEWLIIGAAPVLTEDGGVSASYFITFSGGSMVEHHALGLLKKGADLLEGYDE